MGERNAIRRALRSEAAWRRRKNVVLLKTYLKKQLQAEAATAPIPLSASTRPRLRMQSPNRVGVIGIGESILGGRLKRTGGANSHPLAEKPTKAVATAEGGRGGENDRMLLRRVLEGVVDLAAREEALFRQIVMFL